MPSPTIAPPRHGERDFLAHLSCLGPARRLAHYRAGLFNRRQLTLWASAYPAEPPLVNDELEWIALGRADLD